MTDWTDPETFARALDRAETLPKGNHFEDFEVGETVEHDAGLALSAHGTDLWASQTLNHDPAYWRADAARKRGFDGPPVHPDYLLACVMGATVEDLSEKGGFFLGRDDVVLHRHGVPRGTEVRVESTVESARPSSSRPAYGVVTWATAGYDAGTGDPLVSYERTNTVPRREPAATDGGGGNGAVDGEAGADGSPESSTPDALPDPLVAPEGPYFEDFRAALDAAEDRGGAVAYRHERGRTVDDVLLSALPLSTLNTAGQHYDAAAMADSPAGEPVAYGDVTRSVALGHARSDERTVREVGYDGERFHDFVTRGDTVYGFTRVLDADPDPGSDVGVDGDVGVGDDVSASAVPGDVAAGRVAFAHYAFDQNGTPVYSGRRTALVEKREGGA